MARLTACTLAVFFLLAGSLLAEEIKGKLKKIPTSEAPLDLSIITEDGKEMPLSPSPNMQMYDPKGHKRPRTYLAKQHSGTPVTVKVSGENGHKVAEEIHVTGEPAEK